ncbi:MAG TPA: hypothetical protein VF103_00295 [Polyangiaceae bacterium]
MDGPVVLHAAWIFALVWVWVYRRFFETDAPAAPEFEAFCRGRPDLAKLVVRTGSEREIAADLTRRLGRRLELVPTLAGYPWTLHVLVVEVVAQPGEVRLVVTGCRPLRTRERPLPRLTDTLLDVVESHPDGMQDSWLRPEACVDVTGRTLAPGGWRLVPGAERARPCEPRDGSSDPATRAGAERARRAA